MRRRVRITVDVVMFILFFYLMGYHPGSGLLSHGVMGTVLLLMFILHLCLNLGWFKTLSKGHYTLPRIFFTSVDCLLLLDFIVMTTSSFMMSGMIFYFSPIPMSQLGRDLHVSSTAWGFVLMSIHLAWHLRGELTRLERKIKKTVVLRIYQIFYAVLLCGGIYCFIESGLPTKLILQDAWQPSFDPTVLYTNYLMTVVTACLLVHLPTLIRKKE